MKSKVWNLHRVLSVLLALTLAAASCAVSFAAEEDPAGGDALVSKTVAAEAEPEAEGDVDIAGAKITGIVSKAYTGKAQTQTGMVVKVGNKTLKEGTDYTVKYTNNIKVGTATVTLTAVEGSGYTGMVKKTFRIGSRSAKKIKLSGATLTFRKAVLYDDPLPSSTVPKDLQLTGARNSIRLTWKKPAGVSQIDGYVIFRTTGNGQNFTQIATVGKNTVSYVDKTAKKRNKYYCYRLVAFKNDGGKIRASKTTTYWVGGVTSNSSKKNLYKPEFKTKAKATLAVGKSQVLKIKFPKRLKSKKIRWSTSNAKVAVVSSGGKVTAKGSGTCYIYAQSTTGRKASFKITVPATKKVLKGIDVSTWQYTIDWAKVKSSGIDFAIIRVGFRGSSNGKLVLDNRYKQNIQGAKSVGLKVGVYFFTQAKTYQEGVEEARFVYNQIKGYHMDLPVTIDTEYLNGRTNKLTRQQRTQAVKGFCEEMKRLGYTPMIYASLSWFDNKLDMSQLPYKVWVAQWASKCQYPGKVQCWQYTSDGRVNGINGRVDLDYWYN